MRRLLVATATASMFLLSSRAGAQDMPAAMTVKAKLKLDGSTGSAQTFIYVTGDASIYPDGTFICVGVQAPGRADWIRPLARCHVSKGQFLAEIGPWDKHFPPGRYRVVAEFKFEDQPKALQETLLKTRDMEKCVDDPELEKEYADKPERLAYLKRMKAEQKGRCPGKTADAETWLQVGTDSEADQASITDRETLRGNAEEARRLALELAPIGAGSTNAGDTLREWRSTQAQLDADIQRRLGSAICSLHPEAWKSLQNAFLSLSACADDAESLASGEGARLSEEIEALESKDESVKDDRRRLSTDRAALEAIRKARLEHAGAAAQSLAGALFGTNGLDPAPERAAAFTHDLLAAFGAPAPK